MLKIDAEMIRREVIWPSDVFGVEWQIKDERCCDLVKRLWKKCRVSAENQLIFSKAPSDGSV